MFIVCICILKISTLNVSVIYFSANVFALCFCIAMQNANSRIKPQKRKANLASVRRQPKMILKLYVTYYYSLNEMFK